MNRYHSIIIETFNVHRVLSRRFFPTKRSETNLLYSQRYRNCVPTTGALPKYNGSSMVFSSNRSFFRRCWYYSTSSGWGVFCGYPRPLWREIGIEGKRGEKKCITKKGNRIPLLPPPSSDPLSRTTHRKGWMTSRNLHVVVAAAVALTTQKKLLCILFHGNKRLIQTQAGGHNNHHRRNRDKLELLLLPPLGDKITKKDLLKGFVSSMYYVWLFYISLGVCFTYVMVWQMVSGASMEPTYKKEGLTLVVTQTLPFRRLAKGVCECLENTFNEKAVIKEVEWITKIKLLDPIRRLSEIHRGDIVLLVPPSDPTKLVSKRVVGISGDVLYRKIIQQQQEEEEEDGAAALQNNHLWKKPGQGFLRHDVFGCRCQNQSNVNNNKDDDDGHGGGCCTCSRIESIDDHSNIKIKLFNDAPRDGRRNNHSFHHLVDDPTTTTINGSKHCFNHFGYYYFFSHRNNQERLEKNKKPFKTYYTGKEDEDDEESLLQTSSTTTTTTTTSSSLSLLDPFTTTRSPTYYCDACRTSVLAPDTAIQVRPGCVWVEGDNFTNSNDSRIYGDVPLGLVLGVCRWHFRPPHWDFVPDSIRQHVLYHPFLFTFIFTWFLSKRKKHI